jgi:hypothetical protein
MGGLVKKSDLLSSVAAAPTTAEIKQVPLIEHDDSMKGVLVVCPAYGQFMSAFTGGIFYSLGQLLTAARIPNQFIWFSMADVVEVRNVFLTLWYDAYPQFSHMLMVDNDMHFSPYLVRDMIKFGKPLTGCFYSRREMPPTIIGHTLDGEPEIRDGFQKVKHMGGGVLLIKRDVVTQMLKKIPEVNDLRDVGTLGKTGVTRMIRGFDRMHDDNGSYLSEDFAFCERWRQCGGEVWASISQPIGHIGPFNFCVQYDQLQDHQQVKQAEANAAVAA